MLAISKNSSNLRFSPFLLSVGLVVTMGTTVPAFRPIARQNTGEVPAPPASPRSQSQQTQLRVHVLRVTVTDSHQHPLKGAACSLRRASELTGSIATATTNEQGIATFSAIVS